MKGTTRGGEEGSRLDIGQNINHTLGFPHLMYFMPFMSPRFYFSPPPSVPVCDICGPIFSFLRGEAVLIPRITRHEPEVVVFIANRGLDESPPPTAT